MSTTHRSANPTRPGSLGLAGVTVTGSATRGHSFAAAPGCRGPQPSFEEALARLTEGNRRYRLDKAVNCNNNCNRRAEVSGAQAPFAIVLGCSDSRVPPEIVFDQRLGDLFVVRVAGNVLDAFGIASMEYAVEHFRPPLLLVLGHERCGAVKAALEAQQKPRVKMGGHLGSLVNAIAPAVRSAAGQPGDALDNAVRSNIKMVAASLPGASGILRAAAATHELRIVGMRYSLADGVVTVV